MRRRHRRVDFSDEPNKPVSPISVTRAPRKLKVPRINAVDYRVKTRTLKRLKVDIPRGTKKGKVYELGVKVCAAVTIQRAFRRKMISANDTCPVMMDPIEWPFVSLKVDDLRYTRISLEAIEGMLNAARTMTNPMTRQPMTCDQIDRARDLVMHYTGRMTRAAYPTRGHLYRARDPINHFAVPVHEEQGFSEREATDVITTVMHMIENYRRGRVSRNSIMDTVRAISETFSSDVADIVDYIVNNANL